MDFRELIITKNPPRLVIQYQRVNDTDNFTWGVVGKMPVMSCIGYIARVQSEIIHRLAEDRDCPESAMVIMLVDGNMDWYVHPDIPEDTLVGMLETIKFTLTSSLATQQSTGGVLGPDGNPLRRY